MANKVTMISIDPGFRGTGVAVFFENDSIPKTRTLTPSSFSKSLESRTADIVNALYKFLFTDLAIEKRTVLNSCIEYPVLFRGDGGQMVAEKGDLVKLTFICGVLWNFLYLYVSQSAPELVEVIAWKGTLPKEVSNSRVREFLRLNGEYSSHELDAIGIGLHVMTNGEWYKQ